MPKILIVDDSRLARHMTVKAFRAVYPDWDLIQASSGEEALERLQEGGFDFATLDLNMHGISGIETKRAMNLHCEVPTVLLTANVQDAVRAQAEGLFVGFLEKPVDADRLLELVGKHVQSSA